MVKLVKGLKVNEQRYKVSCKVERSKAMGEKKNSMLLTDERKEFRVITTSDCFQGNTFSGQVCGGSHRYCLSVFAHTSSRSKVMRSVCVKHLP